MSMLLAACSAPKLPALKPPLPAAWRNAPASTAPAPDLHDWWRAFGDPQLDALIDRALTRNLDVAQAAERLRAARMLYRHADDGFLPNLHARTNDVINPDTTASYFIAGFDAEWELPLFGVWASTRRVAQGDLLEATANLRGARVSLVAEIARHWIELRSAQQQDRLLTTIRDANCAKQRLLTVRARLGLAAPAEVAAAQAACADADAALSEPAQAIDANAQQLAVLLGQSEPDPAWLQSGPQPQLGALQIASAPAELLRTRPEIARAEAAVIRAAGELGISRAQIYPHIGIGSSIQWALNIASTRRAHTGEGIFSLGPEIDVPLFDWGQRVAEAHANDHQLRAAVDGYRQAVLEGVAEVETALGELHQASLREQALARAGQATDVPLAAARKRHALGLDSALQVQDGLIEQQRADLQQVDARAHRDLAYVALYKALGGAPLPRHGDPDAPRVEADKAASAGAR